MINIEKFICSLLADHPVGVTVREDIHKALKDQGLEYKGGKIVPIEDKTTLAESEDEKIRKAIIKIVKKDEERIGTNAHLKKIQWLEKQGEKGTNGNEREIPNSEQKPTWKPSDEQMRFLWKYAEQNNYDGRVLTSLYNDLKKLREK